MSYKIKKILNNVSTIILSAIIMVFSVSSLAFSYPVSVENKASVAKAIGHFNGTFRLYNMQQTRDIFKYLLDNHPPTELTSQQRLRFLDLPYVEQAVQKNNVAVMDDMMGIFSQGSSVNLPSLATMSANTCQTNQSNGQQTCYSNDSATTLFDTPQYSSLQAEAAKNYITIIAGDYNAIEPPDPNWDQSLSAVQKYQAFYKNTQAVQALINLVLAKAYSSRLAGANNTPSQSKLYNAIMLGDATSSNFWQALEKLPIISQLIVMASDIKAITVAMASISHRLEMTNVLLASMLSQQNQLSAQASLKLYSDAKNASEKASQSDNS